MIKSSLLSQIFPDLFIWNLRGFFSSPTFLYYTLTVFYSLLFVCILDQSSFWFLKKRVGSRALFSSWWKLGGKVRSYKGSGGWMNKVHRCDWKGWAGPVGGEGLGDKWGTLTCSLRLSLRTLILQHYGILRTFTQLRLPGDSRVGDI